MGSVRTRSLHRSQRVVAWLVVAWVVAFPGSARSQVPDVLYPQPAPGAEEAEEEDGEEVFEGQEDVQDDEEKPARPPHSIRSIFGHERDEQTPWWNQSWRTTDVINQPPLGFAYFLTGSWFGLREALFDVGLEVHGHYIQESLGNPTGGETKGFTYTHNLGIEIVADLDKLVDWPGAHFRAKYSQRSGESLSKRKIGNNFSVQQIFGGGQTSRLVNAQLEQSLFEDRINLSLGRIVYNDEFQHSPLNCQFVNNAFCGNPIAIFRNVPGGATAYPTATWGARIRVRPSTHTYIMAAIYDGDPDQGESNDHGIDWDFGDNAELYVFEGGWVPAHGLLGLPAAYKIGGWYHRGKFDDLVQDINGDNALITGLPARQRRGNGGWYIMVDQMLYREQEAGGQGLYFLMSLMFAPDRNINVLPFFYTAGLAYIGLIPGRPEDKLVLGAVTGFVRDNLRDGQREAGVPVQNEETVVELNYHIQLTPFLYFRPDMQYVIKPNGFASIDDALVLGFELGIRF